MLGELANYSFDGKLLLPVPLTVSSDFKGASSKWRCRPAGWSVARNASRGRPFQDPDSAAGLDGRNGTEFQAAWDAAPRDLPGKGQPAAPGEQSLQVGGWPDCPADWRGRKLEIFPEVAGLISPGAAWTTAWKGERWGTTRCRCHPTAAEKPDQVALVLSVGCRQGTMSMRLDVPVEGGWPRAAGNAPLLPLKAAGADHRTSPAIRWRQQPAGGASGLWSPRCSARGRQADP